jgi:DNA-binding transcriptional LysR family regulator
VDLRHLETFVKIAELKSFTAAAEALYLTQPTVSKQIVDLERYFDIRLLDRTKRSVALTKAGEILLKYAKDFLYLKKELGEAMADFKGLRSGDLQIGASSIPGVYILPQLLQMFKGEYDRIQVRLLISDSGIVTKRMEDGDIDIGFVGAREESTKVEYRKIMDDTIILVAPLGYPDEIPAADLVRYPFISRELGSGTRKSFDAALSRLGIIPGKNLQITAELSDTEAIKGAVKSGMGISYISELAVTGEISRYDLKQFRVTGFQNLKRAFYVITRKGKAKPPQVKALMNILDKWKKMRERRCTVGHHPEDAKSPGNFI